MAKKNIELYKLLVEDLSSSRLSTDELSKPDATVEKEVTNIYIQARDHREKLVNFYIIYTIGFTIFVFGLIAYQAYVRTKWLNSQFEIIPQWALNILVTGMFAQFVGLLTIVTKRVWDFKPFFDYHSHMKDNSSSDSHELNDNSK